MPFQTASGRRITPTRTSTTSPVTRSARRYQRTIPVSNRAVTPTPLPTLNRKQAKVARTVLGTGLRKRVSPKDLLAAVETGLVESRFQNLRGGDADSAGWRQERASLYPDPTNVSHSAKRFYAELQKATGLTAGDLAANVQRPAAQYRSRYQQAKARAVPILQAFLESR